MPIESRPSSPRGPSASLRAPGALVLALAIGGCAAPSGWSGGAAGSHGDGPGDRSLAARSVVEPVRDLPKSRRGNMAEYTVLGRRYRTLESAAGYRERGVASWYGSKFHGRDTSSGEPFDMHAMTAAHRHLPLPTFVRVTDVASGRSVVVKVNDRGPFVDDRLLDLSYAAALRLGMLESGTADVVVEALSTHTDAPDGEALAGGAGSGAATVLAGGSDAAGGAAGAVGDGGLAAADATVPDGGRDVPVIQLGAFRDGARAASLARRAEAHLDTLPSVVHDPANALWRVRIGPLADAVAVAETLAALATAGIDDYTLVTATSR